MNDRNLNYGAEIINKWVKKINLSRILDIGAGSGRDLNICYNENRDSELHAIDFIENTVSNKILKPENHVIQNIEIETFKFDDKSKTLIIANQILEHCKEIFWIHHEIFRILEVGGSFIVGFPNLASYYNRLALLLGRQPYCIRLESAHVRGFTKMGYEDFLSDSIKGKYKIHDFKGANFVPFPNIIASKLSKIFPNYSTCIFFLIEKTKDYNGEFLLNKEILQTNFKLTK